MLEQRGVGSYHELSLISDQEYSKVTRTGMTKDEIARLRTVLAQADTIVGSAGSGAGKPPVLKAAVANLSSEQKQEQGLVGGFTQRLSFLGTFAEGLATTALQEVVDVGIAKKRRQSMAFISSHFYQLEKRLLRSSSFEVSHFVAFKRHLRVLLRSFLRMNTGERCYGRRCVLACRARRSGKCIENFSDGHCEYSASRQEQRQQRRGINVAQAAARPRRGAAE